MRVCTTEEMRAAEAAAAAKGTSYEQLMENAGRASAEAIRQIAGELPSSALLFCGKGNNGGDALVIARLLDEADWQVSLCFLCGEELSPLSALNRSRLPARVKILSPEEALAEAEQAAYLIDGVFGIGFHGELPDAVRKMFRAVNDCGGVRIALDLPSGMNADTGECSPDTFCADCTYTFGAYKSALTKDASYPWCGEVVCLDIGL